MGLVVRGWWGGVTSHASDFSLLTAHSCSPLGGFIQLMKVELERDPATTFFVATDDVEVSSASLNSNYPPNLNTIPTQSQHNLNTISTQSQHDLNTFSTSSELTSHTAGFTHQFSGCMRAHTQTRILAYSPQCFTFRFAFRRLQSDLLESLALVFTCRQGTGGTATQSVGCSQHLLTCCLSHVLVLSSVHSTPASQRLPLFGMRFHSTL